MLDDHGLRAVLVDVLLIDEDDYRDEVGPGDVPGWDSMGTVEIAAALERTCGWRMELADLASVRSIGDLKHLLRRDGVLR